MRRGTGQDRPQRETDGRLFFPLGHVVEHAGLLEKEQWRQRTNSEKQLSALTRHLTRGESLRVCTRAGTLEAVGTAIQRLRYVALSFGQQLQPIVRCVYRFRWRGLTWSWQEQLWCRSALSAMDSELYFLQPF